MNGDDDNDDDDDDNDDDRVVIMVIMMMTMVVVVVMMMMPPIMVVVVMNSDDGSGGDVHDNKDDDDVMAIMITRTHLFQSHVIFRCITRQKPRIPGIGIVERHPHEQVGQGEQVMSTTGKLPRVRQDLQTQPILTLQYCCVSIQW